MFSESVHRSRQGPLGAWLISGLCSFLVLELGTSEDSLTFLIYCEILVITGSQQALSLEQMSSPHT